MTTAIEATGMIRTMVKLEANDGESVNDALTRISHRYGLPFWPLSHLRKGNAKKLDGSLGDKIRRAYLDFCATFVARMELGICRMKAAGHDLDGIGAEVAALAGKIRAERAALKRP